MISILSMRSVTCSKQLDPDWLPTNRAASSTDSDNPCSVYAPRFHRIKLHKKRRVTRERWQINKPRAKNIRSTRKLRVNPKPSCIQIPDSSDSEDTSGPAAALSLSDFCREYLVTKAMQPFHTDSDSTISIDNDTMDQTQKDMRSCQVSLKRVTIINFPRIRATPILAKEKPKNKVVLPARTNKNENQPRTSPNSPTQEEIMAALGMSLVCRPSSLLEFDTVYKYPPKKRYTLINSYISAVCTQLYMDPPTSSNVDEGHCGPYINNVGDSGLYIDSVYSLA